MADHDPLCHAAVLTGHDPECCDCDLIVRVRSDQDGKSRADEDEKIAKAMYEAMADRIEVDGMQYIAVADAAWLARNRGPR